MKYFTFLLVLVLESENYSVALFPRSSVNLLYTSSTQISWGAEGMS